MGACSQGPAGLMLSWKQPQCTPHSLITTKRCALRCVHRLSCKPVITSGNARGCGHAEGGDLQHHDPDSKPLPSYLRIEMKGLLIK